MKVLLSKHTKNRGIEFVPAYFNSTSKTISSTYNLDESIQKVLYIIDNWINVGSGWVIE